MGCLSVVPGFLIQTLHCFLDSTAVLARVFESQAARARGACGASAGFSRDGRLSAPQHEAHSGDRCDANLSGDQSDRRPELAAQDTGAAEKHSSETFTA